MRRPRRNKVSLNGKSRRSGLPVITLLGLSPVATMANLHRCLPVYAILTNEIKMRWIPCLMIYFQCSHRLSTSYLPLCSNYLCLTSEWEIKDFGLSRCHYKLNPFMLMYVHTWPSSLPMQSHEALPFVSLHAASKFQTMQLMHCSI